LLLLPVNVQRGQQKAANDSIRETVA